MYAGGAYYLVGSTLRQMNQSFGGGGAEILFFRADEFVQKVILWYPAWKEPAWMERASGFRRSSHAIPGLLSLASLLDVVLSDSA